MRMKRIFGNRIAARLWVCAAVLMWPLVLLVALPAMLRADDCDRDKSRLEDCLRSNGYAQGIATTVAVAATILVNGAAIQTLILKPRTVEVKPGEDPPPPVNYSLDIKTQGQQTTVTVDSEEPLWIYAAVTCTDPKIDTAALTASITFAAGGANADWLLLGNPAGSGGYQAVAATAQTPEEGAVLKIGTTAVYVYAPAEGQTLTASVPIDLRRGDYEIEFV